MVHSLPRSLHAASLRLPPVHYQTYLTPQLHRKFVSACALVVLNCYIQAVWISTNTSVFWKIIPLGWTGIRCMALFMLTALPVLVLRISQLRVTPRPRLSDYHAIYTMMCSSSTYASLLAYMFTCLVYAMIYFSSAEHREQLVIVVSEWAYQQPRLNERFLYLVFFASYCGLVHAIDHCLNERSKLQLFYSKVTSMDTLKASLLGSFRRVLFLATVITCTAIPVYLPLRALIWEYSISLANRIYWLNLSTVLPPFPVGPRFLLKSVSLAASICWTIEASHLCFTAYFTEYPFPDDVVISDKSADPNGTLLTGLRCTQAALTQHIAFWELAFIAENRPDRRKSIFTDTNRKPSVWEQILHECLKSISDVEIKLSVIPDAPGAVESCATHKALATSEVPAARAITRSSQPAVVPLTGTKSQRLLESIQLTEGASKNFATKYRLAHTWVGSENDLVRGVRSRLLTYLGSPYGKPFRQTLEFTVSRFLPNVGLKVHSIKALALLVSWSLSEDDYGLVQNHLCTILERLCDAFDALGKFANKPPVHWTDVDRSGHLINSPPIELKLLANELRAALERIAESFKPYIGDILSTPLRDRLALCLSSQHSTVGPLLDPPPAE